MNYLKISDGRIVEYPKHFSELGYSITYTKAQFSLYCLYMKKNKVVFLDEAEHAIYLCDEDHPHPFIKVSEEESFDEAPVGQPAFMSDNLAELMDVLIINTPDRRHCLFGIDELPRLDEYPGAEGFGAIWTPAGLMYAAKIEGYDDLETAAIAEENESEGSPEKNPVPVRKYRMHLLDAFSAGLPKVEADEKPHEETAEEVERQSPSGENPVSN